MHLEGNSLSNIIWSFCNLDLWPHLTTERLNPEAEQKAVSQLQTAREQLLDVSSSRAVPLRITHNKWLQSGITQREASLNTGSERNTWVCCREAPHMTYCYLTRCLRKQSLAWAEVDQMSLVCVCSRKSGLPVHRQIILNTPLLIINKRKLQSL